MAVVNREEYCFSVQRLNIKRRQRPKQQKSDPVSVSEVPLDMSVQTHTFVLSPAQTEKGTQMYPWINLTRVTLDTTSRASFTQAYMSASAVPAPSDNMKTSCGHTLLLFFSVLMTHLSLVFNPCVVARSRDLSR